MQSLEIKKELNMTYGELVQYLLEKYGPAKYDYFCNESCKSKNPKVSRTNDGLFCHHIDEDKAIMLCNDKFALNNPWKYQKADRLVYCNVLEHLILHIKIVEEPRREDANDNEVQGIGGAICFLLPQINDYYNGYKFQKEYLIKIYSLVEDNFDDYIYILKYFLNVIEDHSLLSLIISKKRLSVGYTGEVINKIYDRL
jgi:hypothetical protein